MKVKVKVGRTGCGKEKGVGVVMAEDSFDSGASTGADADEVLTDVDDVFDMLV